ncbi:MAG: hypothetical protein LBF12_00610 [Christensenellaceae bacterium]|jgi:hypothetical protein|nr:hypothetical protein [Christensenellaceae bacterium]
MPRKRIALILIIVILVLIILAGVILAIVITKPKLYVPTPVIQEISEGSIQQNIYITWEAQDSAIGYEIEYKYDIKPDEVHNLKIKSPSISVERLKGYFSIRVKACAKYEREDTEFSKWSTSEISGIKLSAPNKLIIDYHANQSDAYYSIMKELWEPVEYTYNGEKKEIVFYEVIQVPPGKTLEEQFLLNERNDRVMSMTTMLNYKMHTGTPGVYKLYVRAVHDKGEFGEFGTIEGEPIELYYVFEDGEWAYCEFEAY